MPEGEPTYFERERDRLSSEIAVVSTEAEAPHETRLTKTL